MDGNKFIESSLITLIYRQKWSEILSRIELYPEEVKSWDSYGCLPLHRVCQSERISIKVVEEIIKVYPVAVREIDKKWGRLPLHCAVRNPYSPPNPNVVKVLLHHFKEGASFPDKYNDTPLHYHLFCSREQSLEIVKMLVEAHPDAVRKSAGFIGYPLHRAVYCGKFDIAKYLVHVYPEALQKRDSCGRIPRELAKDKNGYLYNFLYKEEKERFVKVLETDHIPTISTNELDTKCK